MGHSSPLPIFRLYVNMEKQEKVQVNDKVDVKQAELAGKVPKLRLLGSLRSRSAILGR